MVHWRNATTHYGLVAVVCHWLTALTVFGLFGLGLWMTDLTYYDPWYRKGPDLHRSIGVLLALLVCFRLLWRSVNRQPLPNLDHKLWERRTAWLVHLFLYLLLFVMFFSGYLITTAEGQGVQVFNWFRVPAVVTGESVGIHNLEDVAGQIHEISAFTLVGLAILHAVAALKHHFMDRDQTLLRMLGKAPGRER